LLTQDRTERLLIDAPAGRNVEVQWNTELTSLRNGVAVVRRPGGEERIEADWIVGADGASSRVRGELGLDFAGKTYQQAGMLADVQLDRPPERGTLRLNLTRGGFVGMLDLGNGSCRLFGALPPKFVPAGSTAGVSHDPYADATLPDIQGWFDELFDVDAKVTRVAWAALFRIHSRMVRRFRVGTVFLVGDAAHVHSPAGGQGLNRGIGDAFNLGWKLCLVAAGRADPRLLDSYEAERLPVARSVLRGTDRGFALEATDSPAGVWLRSHLAPHAIGPLLRLRPVRARVAELFAQTWIRYPHSPIVAGPGGGDRTQPGEARAGRTDPRGSTSGHTSGPDPSPPCPATSRPSGYVSGGCGDGRPVHRRAVSPGRRRRRRRCGRRPALAGGSRDALLPGAHQPRGSRHRADPPAGRPGRHSPVPPSTSTASVTG
jgi:2-polyprenyl-6-methoxyphenol hydroxylase-like FAD-dependent oxidoreductase